jgi:G3E family GTPase
MHHFVQVDDALVSENVQEAEDVVALDNGCVCCTVRGDLVRSSNNFTLRDTPSDVHVCTRRAYACSERLLTYTLMDAYLMLCLKQVKALLGFADKRKVFDCILIETTGLADPSPIVR